MAMDEAASSGNHGVGEQEAAGAETSKDGEGFMAGAL